MTPFSTRLFAQASCTRTPDTVLFVLWLLKGLVSLQERCLDQIIEVSLCLMHKTEQPRTASSTVVGNAACVNVCGLPLVIIAGSAGKYFFRPTPLKYTGEGNPCLRQAGDTV